VKVPKALFPVVFFEKTRENAGILRGEILKSDPEPDVSVLQGALVNDVAEGVDNVIPDSEGDVHFGVPRGNSLRNLQKDAPLRQVKGPAYDLEVDTAFRVFVSKGNEIERLEAFVA
jgi:hypothetical protein